MWKVKNSGLTLIELLVVVAIIGILSTIGIANYQLATVKTKVSRAKAEMSTIASALETYYVDNNAYPRWREIALLPPPDGNYAPPVSWRFICLTTPISYFSSIPNPDPFHPWMDILGLGNGKVYDTYDYIDAQSSFDNQLQSVGNSIYGRMWRLASAGPDRIQTYGRSDYIVVPPNAYLVSLGFYDPSNGTISNGDIVRLGPASPYYGPWQLNFEPTEL